LLNATLTKANVVLTSSQYILLVDRSPRVQAALVYWRDGEGEMRVIGASAVSTGRPGGFEYFLTPLGVFEHTIANLDFRAEGTRNEFGIRGYGVAGMRVCDFGWVMGERTWGDGGLSPMRLQVHATDPDALEPRLGFAASKGCIPISESLNQFLDRYGVLDADYDAALERGAHLWVLRKDRTPTPWSGRYLVVVESERGPPATVGLRHLARSREDLPVYGLLIALDPEGPSGAGDTSRAAFDRGLNRAYRRPAPRNPRPKPPSKRDAPGREPLARSGELATLTVSRRPCKA
jgi:hypothetical protein